MSELNLPNLTLFNKTPLRTKREHSCKRTREESPFFDVIRETNRIQDQIYTAYLPYRPHLHDSERRLKDAIQLQYMNAYQDTLRKEQAMSFMKTQKIQPKLLLPERPFRKYDPLAYELSLQNQYAQSQRKILKTPYINHQYVPSAPLNAPPKKSDQIPTKEVYLDSKRNQDQQPKKREEPEISIIQKINKSMLETEKNNYNTNLSKMINDSNYMHTNQSLILDPAPKRELKKELVSEQVQTDEINRSSFFFETRKMKKMDQDHFQKTIQELNNQISNLHLDLSSEDVIIDLSDLVLTKEQYFQESKSILRDLQVLSDERTSSGILIKSKKQGEMIWPQF